MRRPPVMSEYPPKTVGVFIGRGRAFGALVIALAAVSPACHGRRAPVAGSLEGRWTLELEYRPGLFRARRGASGTEELVGDPGTVARCRADRESCEGAVRGTHHVALTPMLGHELPDDAAGAIIPEGVVITLGRCCDRGEISGVGFFTGNEIRGRWSETFLGGGRRGTFTMRRVTPPG